jgi:hypothetical protein
VPWYGSNLRTRRGSPTASDDATATQARRHALALLLPGLLLAVVAIMMLEQSLRWAMTAVGWP